MFVLIQHCSDLRCFYLISDLLRCQLLKMMDRQVRQKWEDGAEEVRRPRGHVAHHVRLQQSFHKSLLLQRLHLWTVVTNGCQPEEQQQKDRWRRIIFKLNVKHSTGDSHAVVHNQGGWEVHYVRNRHEGDELRKVDKELWGHSGELVDESRCHCFHGLQLLLRGLK